jgi:2-oxoglutarate dehydrogenase E1 component
MTLDPLSYAHLGNLGEIESLYQVYLKNPDGVDASWRYFFEGMQLGASREGGHEQVYALVEAYRRYGHLKASCNPIALEPRVVVEELKLERFGLSDLGLEVPGCGVVGRARCTLKELVEALEKIYCRHIGFEYMEVDDVRVRDFLKEAIEKRGLPSLSKEEKLDILTQLTQAELLEAFLHTKYVGQKRFSLEGEETLIPLLIALIKKSAKWGVEEAVLGMSHRGRLNVLANLLNKSYAHIFHEFEDTYAPACSEGSGDVKYHKGFVGELDVEDAKRVKVILTPTPSHLESPDPIVEGVARALSDVLKKKVVPLVVHGDAAFSGQGVVYETLQMMRLEGYQTQGTLHIIVNNQIGFTTTPREGRSTRYCCAIARAFGCPVFHVNAEDPVSCVQVALLAAEVRELFKCDVFIDLCGYRKYGHNEGDEPFFTQPLEYALIRQKKSIPELYLEDLVAEGVLTREKAREESDSFRAHLQEALEQVKSGPPLPPVERPEGASAEVPTAVPPERLEQLATRCCTVPESLRLHPKLTRLLHERREKFNAPESTPSIDWGMAEQLVFSSLLEDKVPLRLSGQDTQRGTFSHRHVVWTDQVTGKAYTPFGQWSTPAFFCNSPLSEYAVLGFDFGYSMADTGAFVLWEAQFGDFVNGAQIIIDQYISSGEQKWGIKSNLTLLLPHGYEGQGPDHSSARLERFLQLCAQENMRVAICSTPAQLFHLLRQQALCAVKKPLILFTPKGLLRHPRCVSSRSDFSTERFQEVIDDAPRYRQASRVALCTGRIYYDLLEERERRGSTDVALIRIEQLYPFPQKTLDALFKNYPGQLYWVQEEPQNMGAWSFIEQRIRPLSYVGRSASASTATSSHVRHQEELTHLLNSLFGPP